MMTPWNGSRWMMPWGRRSAGAAVLLLFGLVAASSCAGAPGDPDETSAEGLGAAEQAVGTTCLTIQDLPNPPQDGIDDAPISFDPADPLRASTNYGLTQQMNTGYIGTEYREILMQFDLSSIPFDSVVTSATLSFRMIQSPGKQPLEFHAITVPWAESTVTWASFAQGFDPAAFLTVPTVGVPNNSTLSADLTALVASWVSGVAPAYGIAITHPLQGRTILGATEAPTAGPRPKLAVCFIPPACDDGIQNGSEQGVDCGGSCPTSCEYCGNGLCAAATGEDCSTCAADCGSCCGNGSCDPATEDCSTCAADCGSCCGNGSCDPATEDCSTCSADCGPCVTWTCDPLFYGTGDGCDCGCGVVDPDCADGTSASCQYCSDLGSCDTTLTGCPGLIDPSDNAICALPVCGDLVCGLGESCSTCPADCGPCGWTCDPLFYGAADGCDCGCGVVDSDCIDGTSASCQYCNDAGSCDPVSGACPGNIDPNDNAICAAFCGDLTCDAGEDCSTCPGDCAACAWTCNPAYYGTSDGCDCGCGVVDPDCADGLAGSCEFCNGIGGCDTTGSGCPGVIDPNDNSTCAFPVCGDLVCAPGEDCSSCAADCGVCGWTCDQTYYGAADGCDCGCGIVDPDCIDGTSASCQYCNDLGSCDSVSGACPGNIDPNDNAICSAFCGDLACNGGEDCSSCPGDCGPCAWTCNLAYYGTNDGCDCGCGAVDPDCADGLSGSCQYCNDSGSCDTTLTGCPGLIDPNDNSICGAANCGDLICGAGENCSSCPGDCGACAWTCNLAYYGTNDGCDCGCGLVDPDCFDNTSAYCQYCADSGSCASTCGDIDPNDNATCGP